MPTPRRPVSSRTSKAAPKEAKEPVVVEEPETKEEEEVFVERSIRFVDTPGDRTLLSQVDQHLQEHRSENLRFSDLCKQALQQFFNPTPVAPSSNDKEEEIAGLYQRITELERRLTSLAPLNRVEYLENLVNNLSQALETRTIATPESPAAAQVPQQSIDDPTIRHLSELLEDF